MDLYSLLLVPLSPSTRLTEESITQDKGTTCTSSQVRTRDFPLMLSMVYCFSSYHHSGLGLAAILSRASQITDSMVEASSLGLANSLTEEETALGLLYPRVERSKSLMFLKKI